MFGNKQLEGMGKKSKSEKKLRQTRGIGAVSAGRLSVPPADPARYLRFGRELPVPREMFGRVGGSSIRSVIGYQSYGGGGMTFPVREPKGRHAGTDTTRSTRRG